jgi:hypothetical protein
LEAVFYDSDSSQAAIGLIAPPMLTELASTPITVNANWGGYEKVSVNVEYQNWVIPHTTRYVGFRWQAACPALYLEDLLNMNEVVPPATSTNGAGVYRTVVWYRSAPPAAWTNGWVSSMTPFSLEVTPLAICGDNMTMDGEPCDGGLQCNPDCTCPFNYIKDTYAQTSWDLIGCQCPDAVVLDPHWFVGPPTMNVTRVGDTLDIGVLLPQARPSRWSPTAGLANWDGSYSPLSRHNWKLEHFQCYFWGENNIPITDLFQFGNYSIKEHDDFYELDFSIGVHWMERIVFGRNKTDGFQKPVDRTMTATLVIGLLVDRTVKVNSTIWILDPNIIWAYVAKSFLFLENGDFFVDLEIVTRVKSENITINPTNFWATGKSATGNAINWVSNLTRINGPIQDPMVQYWRLRVHLISDPCTTDWHDNYTLSYELIHSKMEENINPHRETFFLTISKFEDWCGVTTEIGGLEGVQRTYLDVDLLKPATRFWPNDTVVVGVEVQSKFGLNIENVTLISSRLTGAGLRSDAVIFNVTTGWRHPWYMAQDLLGVSANCTGKTGCYSFVLPDDQVVYNKPVTIITVVMFSATGGVKRTVTVEHTTAVSRFSVYARTTPLTSDPTFDDVTFNDAINYKMSAPFLFAISIVVVVPIISLIVIVFLTRSRLHN